MRNILIQQAFDEIQCYLESEECTLQDKVNLSIAAANLFINELYAADIKEIRRNTEHMVNAINVVARRI